jgi:hypothetical protein
MKVNKRSLHIALGVGLALTLALVLGVTACARATPTVTATPVAPYDGLDALVRDSDLAIIGEVTSVGSLKTIDTEQQRVWYYDAEVGVEQTLFGPQRQQVIVRVVMYTGPEDGSGNRLPTKAPLLEKDSHVALFLKTTSGALGEGNDVMFLYGGGLLWGVFFIQGDQVRPYAALSPNEPKPLESFVDWVRQAQMSFEIGFNRFILSNFISPFSGHSLSIQTYGEHQLSAEQKATLIAIFRSIREL